MLTLENNEDISLENLFTENFNNLPSLEHEKLKLNWIKKFFNEQNVLDFKKTQIDLNNSCFSQKILYYFLVTFGLIEQCAGSFVFGSTLFGLIPGLSQFSLIAVSLIYTLLDSLLFYSFEISFLKEALGIQLNHSDLSSIIQIYKEQLYYVELINIHINALKRNGNLNSSELINTLQILNDDLIKKCEQMQEYKISNIRQTIQYGVLTFGVLSNIAESYFLAHSFLLLLSPAIGFAGIGYLLIAITIIANLGFFYAMGANAVVKIMHPELDEYKALKNDLNNFTRAISEPQNAAGI